MSLRKLIKSFVLTAVSVYITTLIIPGFVISPGFNHLLLATLIFTLLNLTLRPLLKLLLLPINLITLGAFRWLVNILVVYLWDFLSSDLTISGFSFQGFFIGRFVTTILISFTISLVQGFLLWMVK